MKNLNTCVYDFTTKRIGNNHFDVDTLRGNAIFSFSEFLFSKLSYFFDILNCKMHYYGIWII